MADDVILTTRGLTKEFKGFVAVRNVDLSVRRGTIHALIGPNGAGKTTCFNLLTHFLTPTAGQIFYNGREITGSRPADIVAVLGPSIGACCYEVGEELRAEFGPEGGDFFRPGPRGKPHLDVRAANLRQLQQAGLVPAHLHDVADCTMCRADLYHSYRREGRGAGRMISFVGFAK